MLNKKAFTLIELLVIIAIIGILALAIMIGIISARNRAKDASFKTVANSIQTALVSCCINPGAALGNVVGGLICAGGSNYPDAMSVGIISAGNCNSNGDFSKTITPGSKNKGSCINALINRESISYDGC